jgi:hypothetical protein
MERVEIGAMRTIKTKMREKFNDIISSAHTGTMSQQ